MPETLCGVPRGRYTCDRTQGHTGRHRGYDAERDAPMFWDPDPVLPSGQYVIWSIEHTAWWRAGEMGYTGALVEAGIYGHAAANRILANANLVKMNECAIPLDAVGLAARTQA